MISTRSRRLSKRSSTTRCGVVLLRRDSGVTLFSNKSHDTGHSRQHALPRSQVGSVDIDVGWVPIGRGDTFLDPTDHIVSRPANIITEIMVKADVSDPTSNQLRDHLVRPASEHPAPWGWAFIVQVDLHGRGSWRYRSGGGQRSEGAGGPYRHGQREQERSGGTASEADSPADDANGGAATGATGLLRASIFIDADRLVADESHRDPSSEPPEETFCDWIASLGVGMAGDINHTLVRLTHAIFAFPPEVPRHRLLLGLWPWGRPLQGVADTLKLIHDESQLVGENLNGILEAGDVGGSVGTHATHDTRRAA